MVEGADLEPKGLQGSRPCDVPLAADSPVRRPTATGALMLLYADYFLIIVDND